MERYEEIWEGISEEAFSGAPEEMQAEYIDIPREFLEEKLTKWWQEVDGNDCWDRLTLK